MNKLFPAAILLTAALASASVTAHGTPPKYGGVAQTANDLSFELVRAADGVVIYVDDHGKPLATRGMSGKLTVLNASGKSEGELKPAGDNRLEVKGIRLEAGAKAVAAITTAPKKVVTVRFSMK